MSILAAVYKKLSQCGVKTSVLRCWNCVEFIELRDSSNQDCMQVLVDVACTLLFRNTLWVESQIQRCEFIKQIETDRSKHTLKQQLSSIVQVVTETIQQTGLSDKLSVPQLGGSLRGGEKKLLLRCLQSGMLVMDCPRCCRLTTSAYRSRSMQAHKLIFFPCATSKCGNLLR